MDKEKLSAACIVIALVAGMHLPATKAHAVLGESAFSVDADKDALSAERRTETVRIGYTVQEIHSESVDVREYISPSGTVFGIAWNGLIHPDLDRLLGPYAGDYRKASKSTERRPGSRSIRMTTDRLVLEEWGHMRDLHGRAFDPALIPPGVNAEEIQ